MANAPPSLDAESAARSRRVVDRLRALSGPTGFLAFDRFMEVALYDAQDGYYQRANSPLGSAGDFYTASHVHPLFAACVAERIRAVRVALGTPRPFRIVELGPGDGTLAAGIASRLEHDEPGLEYVLVDRAPSRAREAEQRVRSAAETLPVRRVESVGGLGPFAGVVLANEFLDAQPARRLRWDGARWREMGIRVRDGRVEAAEEEGARPVPGAPLPAPGPAGTVFEFSPLAEGIVREIADHLSEGAAILVDYGLEEPELVRGHRHGTLAAVRGHRFVEDPLDAPGASDLSAFVNFTRLRAAARAAGLVEVGFRSQAEALGVWGFPALFDEAVRAAGSPEAEVRLRMAVKNLLFGFERFRVLELTPPGPPGAVGSST